MFVVAMVVVVVVVWCRAAGGPRGSITPMGSYGHNRGLSQTNSFVLGTHSATATNAPASASPAPSTAAAAKPAPPQRAAPKKPDAAPAEVSDQERAAVM